MMNRSILLLALLLSLNAQAGEMYMGVGYTYKADVPGYDMISLTYEFNDYKFEIAKFDEYSRTPWYDDHPEWRSHINIIPKHYTISVTKGIFRVNLVGKLAFYFDLGLAYSSGLSRVNSTHVLFKENAGIEYDDFRLYLRHTSNAGLSGQNTGEDALVLEWGF